MSGVLALGCASAPPGDPNTHAHELARRLIILDGHVDVPYRLTEKPDDISVRTKEGDFDYPRAVAGGLDAPFFSIYVPSEYEQKGGAKAFADTLIDGVEEIVARSPDKFSLARSAADVRRIAGQRKIAILMGMENGSPMEGELRNVDHFHSRGIRYVTLCHGKDNHICDSSYDTKRTWKGLSPFGREVVRRMNDLGVLVDVSHVSDDAFFDVIKVTRAPVIASHSSCRHFTPGWERNMSDDMIRELAANGGVIQINFGSSFLRDDIRKASEPLYKHLEEHRKANNLAPDDPAAQEYERRYFAEHPVGHADVSDVADHIDHVVKLVGIEHVGLGSDFDGVGDSLPTGLKDVSMYPNLIRELLKRGYSDAEVEKICSRNVLRVMEAAERIARR
jgi:membrane dipeptidase